MLAGEGGHCPLCLSIGGARGGQSVLLKEVNTQIEVNRQGIFPKKLAERVTGGFSLVSTSLG